MKEPEDTNELHDHDDQPPRIPEEEVDEALKALGNNIKEKFKAAGLGESVTAVATEFLRWPGL
jgi:exopolyphosphatase/pppGpp-phosphohydrolase